MHHFSVLRNLIPYTHLFSARQRHIFAAGALLLQMAAITRRSPSLYSYEQFDKLRAIKKYNLSLAFRLCINRVQKKRPTPVNGPYFV